MTVQRMTVADLSEAQLEKLQMLEDELGTYIVALQPAYRVADLPEEQVERIRAAEQELGVVLLAYEPKQE